MNKKKLYSPNLVNRRLVLILGLFVIFSGSFLLINHLGMTVLSVVRAFVNGEGAYSKGQKNAVFYLSRYASGHNERDFQLYLQQIAIPIGDRKARLELEKPDPDIDLACKWLIEGRNNPEDVKRMALSFNYFKQYAHTRKALLIWQEADKCIYDLTREADSLHTLISGGRFSQQQVDAVFNRILLLNEKLSELENDFSVTFGNAARQIQNVLLYSVLGIVSFLILTFGFIAFVALKRIRQSEERYRTLFEESQSGIVISTPQGSITDVNPAGVHLLDLKSREQALLNGSLTEIYARLESGDILYQKLLQEKGLEKQEIQLLRKDGAHSFISLSVSAQRDYRGKVVAFRHVIRDITERKLAEKQLISQNAELKKNKY